MTDILKTSLYDWHLSQGAKMVPFAGYSMPVQYPMGIKGEHLHCRNAAGLFDVSHMGQLVIEGKGCTQALETMLPLDLAAMQKNQMSYGLLMNSQGGIVDDLMMTKWGDDKFYLVVNASRKAEDLAHIKENLPNGVQVSELCNRALIALQGPKAIAVIADQFYQGDRKLIDQTRFMQSAILELNGEECFVSRSGYTGEDGLEISIPNLAVIGIVEKISKHLEVSPVGLGARDSLRLEAGLCLYGNELNESINPVEAGLMWSIHKTRRPNAAKEGGFLGSDIIERAILEGVLIKRVGLLVEGRAPVRAGALITDANGDKIGEVTSGGFAPSLDKPIAIGYIKKAFAKPETSLFALVRGRHLPVSVTNMPFIKQGYVR